MASTRRSSRRSMLPRGVRGACSEKVKNWPITAGHAEHLMMTDVAEFIRGFTVVNRWELANMCGELMRTWYENLNTYLRTTEN